MTETTETICTWADDAFGPAPSEARILARANEEMAELMVTVVDCDKPLSAMIEESADVAIVLCRLAKLHGCDVDELMARRTKMPRRCDTTPAEAAVASNTALAALLRAVTAEQQDEVVAERLLFLFDRLADTALLAGGQLGQAVDAKMQVNRKRQWRLDGSGHGYHVRPGSAAAEAGA